MGRPATRSGPVVAVSIDAKGAAWCDGIFQGDDELVTYARRAANTHMPVRLRIQTLVADDETPEGAFAALAAYQPGRAVLTEGPADLYGLLEADAEENPAHIWDTPIDEQEG